MRMSNTTKRVKKISQMTAVGRFRPVIPLKITLGEQPLCAAQERPVV